MHSAAEEATYEEEYAPEETEQDRWERNASLVPAPQLPLATPNLAETGVPRQKTPAPEPPAKPKPASLVVEGVSCSGRPLLLETVWTTEIESRSEEFSVDVILSNGLSVVVPHHQDDPNDDNWFVIAKDATHKRRLLARFQSHEPQPTALQMVAILVGSPFSKDWSTLLVLLVATGLAFSDVPSVGGEAVARSKLLLGVQLSRDDLLAWLRSVLLLCLTAAFVVSIFAKLRLSWLRSSKRYQLVIKRWDEENDSLRSAQRLGPGLLGNHTMIYEITKSFRACMSSSEMEGNKAVDLKVGPLLDAIGKSLRIGEVFGPLMVLAVKNDEGNLSKVQKVWSKMRDVDRKRANTLRGLLEAEKEAGIHKPGGHLADPSAAIALLWMRRTLMFQNAVIQGAVDNSGSLQSIARAAYAAQLEQFHGWLLKNTFMMALNGMPSRDELIQRLAPNVKQPMERENLCVQEMRECVSVTQQVIRIMCSLFDELDLEDIRKV